MKVVTKIEEASRAVAAQPDALRLPMISKIMDVMPWCECIGVKMICTLSASRQDYTQHLAAEASSLEQLLDGGWQQLQAALEAAGGEVRREGEVEDEDGEGSDDIGSDHGLDQTAD